MLTRLRGILACGVLAVASTALNACGGSSGAIVAQVGSTGITESTVKHWATIIGSTDQATSGPHSSPTEQALELVVSAEWARKQANELGIEVTAEQAAQRLALFKYEQLEGVHSTPLPGEGELRGYLASPRLTHADALWLVGNDMLRSSIEHTYLARTARRITAQQVATYYNQIKARLVVPERRDYEIIETYHEAPMLEASRELRAGRDFVEVARRLSIAPEGPGALRLDYTRGLGSKALDDAIFTARPHVLVGPLYVSTFYIFKVLDVKPRHLQSLAEAEPALRRELARRGAAALSRTYERMWAARTHCRGGYVASICAAHPS